MACEVAVVHNLRMEITRQVEPHCYYMSHLYRELRKGPVALKRVLLNTTTKNFYHETTLKSRIIYQLFQSLTFGSEKKYGKKASM